MNALNDIIDRHFFPAKGQKIKEVLTEFGLDIFLLNGYNNIRSIGSNSNTSGIEIADSPVFVTTIIATLHDINQKLLGISESKKAHVKQIISELIVRLLLEIIQELEVELKLFVPEFNKVAKAACDIYGYDFIDFQKHINLNEIIVFSHDLSGSLDAEKQEKTRKNVIVWQTGSRAKEELIDLIKKQRHWARKPSRIFKLFNNPPKDLIIIWNKNYLEELAHMIYLLYDKDIIGCIGNRGLFSAVEKHLVDFQGDKIKSGTLKILSHRINKNWRKFEQRLLPVTHIITAVYEKGRN